VKVLVTGGTGFVGPIVVEAIRGRGHDVRALTRKSGAPAGVETVTGDMTAPASLRRAVEGVDVVVHLVAIRQGRRELFDRVMTQGTRDLVAAAKEAGVRRFVLMSALGTSEETKDLVPYYGAKWQMELAVKGSGLEHVIFRPSFVFGSSGGIMKTFRKVAKAPVTPVIGSGRQRIQPIWIGDVGEYFARAVDEPAAANRLFEVGGPDVVTWDEFWVRLKQALGVRRPTVHMPLWFMRANALVTERLPGKIPLTRDLLKMLEGPDSVVAGEHEAPAVFGIEPMPLDEQLRRIAAGA
jgi:uncharacterized protein YbjT (DUF2867 family)